MRQLINLFPSSASISPEGRLKISEHDLADLAKEFGTPLYIYDAKMIREKEAYMGGLLKSSYPGVSDISYAAKAYFSLGLAKKLQESDLTFDVVSLGELKMAKMAGIPAEKVHLHGNSKTEEEMRFALEWGVDNIVVDSLEELEFLQGLAAEMGKVQRIWLRITPGIDVNTHKHVQTAHHESKFGLPIEDGQAEKAIKQAVESKNLHLSGLHTHIGSQIFDPAPFQKAIQMLVELAAKVGYMPEEISPGGGWGVPYTLQDSTFDLESVFSGISDILVEECKKNNWKLPRLVVETGRWLVARAGVSIYRVGTTKFTSNGKYFVAVDGGMSDNPRPALYESKYTACMVENVEAKAVHKGAIVGKFCESGDQLITEIDLPEMKRGDLIAVPVSGAYQLSMASNYNLSTRPAVLWLEEDRVEVLQPREHAEESAWWTGNQEK